MKFTKRKRFGNRGCRPCGESCCRNESLALSQAEPGRRLTIKGYACCLRESMRLVNMGLRIGDQVEVLTNSGDCQVMISVDNKRFALGRGMAGKILVASAE